MMDSDTAAPPEGQTGNEPDPSGNRSPRGRVTRTPVIDPPEADPNDPEEGEETDPAEGDPEDPEEKTQRPGTNGGEEPRLAAKNNKETESTESSNAPAAAVPQTFGGGQPAGAGGPGDSGGFPGGNGSQFGGGSQFGNGLPSNGGGFGGNSSPYSGYGRQPLGGDRLSSQFADSDSERDDFDRDFDSSTEQQRSRRNSNLNERRGRGADSKDQSRRSRFADDSRGTTEADDSMAVASFDEADATDELLNRAMPWLNADEASWARDFVSNTGDAAPDESTGVSAAERQRDDADQKGQASDSGEMLAAPAAKDWELKIKGIDRRQNDLPRLIIEVGRSFDQIQIKFGDEHLAFAAPTKIPSTNTIPLTSAAVRKGSTLTVIGVSGANRIQTDFEVMAGESSAEANEDASFAGRRSLNTTPDSFEW